MKLSKALSAQRSNGLHFPVLHVDGYAGEQDGDTVTFAGGQSASLAEADGIFPGDLPPFVRVHWATYHPGGGWEFGLGAWRSQVPAGWQWPRGLY